MEKKRSKNIIAFILVFLVVVILLSSFLIAQETTGEYAATTPEELLTKYNSNDPNDQSFIITNWKGFSSETRTKFLSDLSGKTFVDFGSNDLKFEYDIVGSYASISDGNIKINLNRDKLNENIVSITYVTKTIDSESRLVYEFDKGKISIGSGEVDKDLRYTNKNVPTSLEDKGKMLLMIGEGGNIDIDFEGKISFSKDDKVIVGNREFLVNDKSESSSIEVVEGSYFRGDNLLVSTDVVDIKTPAGKSTDLIFKEGDYKKLDSYVQVFDSEIKEGDEIKKYLNFNGEDIDIKLKKEGMGDNKVYIEGEGKGKGVKIINGEAVTVRKSDDKGNQIWNYERVYKKTDIDTVYKVSSDKVIETTDGVIRVISSKGEYHCYGPDCILNTGARVINAEIGVHEDHKKLKKLSLEEFKQEIDKYPKEIKTITLLGGDLEKIDEITGKSESYLSTKDQIVYKAHGYILKKDLIDGHIENAVKYKLSELDRKVLREVLTKTFTDSDYPPYTEIILKTGDYSLDKGYFDNPLVSIRRYIGTNIEKGWVFSHVVYEENQFQKPSAVKILDENEKRVFTEYLRLGTSYVDPDTKISKKEEWYQKLNNP
ncbi:MAG: hypothetical protein ABIH37_02955 [archaeon]